MYFQLALKVERSYFSLDDPIAFQKTGKRMPESDFSTLRDPIYPSRFVTPLEILSNLIYLARIAKPCEEARKFAVLADDQMRRVSLILHKK